MKRSVRNDLEKLSMLIFGTKTGWKKLSKYYSSEKVGKFTVISKNERTIEETRKIMLNIIEGLYSRPTDNDELNNNLKIDSVAEDSSLKEKK